MSRRNKYDPIWREKACCLGLSLIPGIGGSRLKALLARFGSASAVLECSKSDIRRLGILEEKAVALLFGSDCAQIGADHLRRVEGLGGRVVSFMDDDYPVNLKPLEEAPPLLYLRGTLEESDSLAVAIVGSRRATAYGRVTAERLAAELARRGVTVISGLAAGIDAAAHRGALKGEGRTLGVLGCGLDVDYPACNRRLREKIVSSGAVMTEFPLGTRPLAGNFPKRNRIVSGLSKGLVVVEAGLKSGTFTTVRWAAEQGRDVFAVPGDINRRTSLGTNRLISEGAKLVTSVDDILDEIGFPRKPVVRAELDSLSIREKTVVSTLEDGPAHVDEIALHAKMPVGEALSVLLSLELKGVVMQSPGKIFILGGDS